MNDSPSVPAKLGGGADGDATLHEHFYANQMDRWRRGERIPVEAYLHRHPELNRDDEVLFELILGEVLVREEQGEPVYLSEFAWRFPRFEERLRLHFALSHAITEDPSSVTPLAGRETLNRMVPQDWPEIVGFEILGELGRGATGIVYSARQVSLNRVVSLKLIVAGRADAQGGKRFRTEAEALARLQHPNIVQIHDIGVHNGHPFLICEYVEGGNLAEAARRAPLAPADAARLVETIAGAAQYAHERGILHRDLKPANVLLTAGQPPAAGGNDRLQLSANAAAGVATIIPKLADFGLAKLIDRTDGQTQSGDVIGTPAYMAPEQACRGGHDVGVAADVYALGAILYESLTGRPPFHADSPLEALMLVRHADPVPPRRLQTGIPADLETICLKCLEKEPSRRYGSARDLADDLRRWLDGKPILARPIGPIERSRRWAARHPWVAGLSLATIVSLVLALVILIVGNAKTAKALHDEQQARAELADALAREQRYVYLDRVTLAHRLWMANQSERAGLMLDQCPDEHRCWEWHYLDRLRQAHIRTIRDHPDGVQCVVYSPNGKLLASGNAAGGVSLWDADSGALLAKLGNHDDAVMHIGFDRDSARVVSASRGAIHVWDVNRKDRAFEFPGAGWAAFSSDGKYLASSLGNAVEIRDARNGDVLRNCKGHEADVVCGSFNIDSGKLCTGDAAGAVRFWDPATGDAAMEPRSYRRPVTGLIHSHDGRHLIVSSVDGTILTEAATGNRVGTFCTAIHHQRAIAVSPNGQWLAVPGSDHAVKIHRTDTQQEVMSLSGNLLASRGVSFSPDSRRVASAGIDGTIRIWELPRAAESSTLAQTPATPAAIKFSPDGRRLAFVFRGNEPIKDAVGRISIMDIEKGTMQHMQGTSDVAFSPDGKWLATISTAGRATLWNLETGREGPAFDIGSEAASRLKFSRNGRYLVVGGQAGSVSVFSIDGGERMKFEGHANLITSVDFSPDGSLLAAGDHAGQISIWETAGGKRLVLIPANQVSQVVAFSPDGTILATKVNAGQVGLREVATGHVLRTLRCHSGSVVSDLAFMEKENRLVSSSDQGIRLWDIGSGQELLFLPTHREAGIKSWVQCIALSPDGRRIAGGVDKSILLWEK